MCAWVLRAQVMLQAGGDVKEEVWRACIVLLTNTPELHAYAARRLYASLRDRLPSAQLSLVATATWYIGAPTPAVCFTTPGARPPALCRSSAWWSPPPGTSVRPPLLSAAYFVVHGVGRLACAWS